MYQKSSLKYLELTWVSNVLHEFLTLSNNVRISKYDQIIFETVLLDRDFAGFITFKFFDMIQLSKIFDENRRQIDIN